MKLIQCVLCGVVFLTPYALSSSCHRDIMNIYLSMLPKLSRRTMKKLTNRLIIVQEITITSKTKHKHLAVYHFSHFQRRSLHTSMFLVCLQNMYQGQSLVLRIGNIQVYRKNHDCWFWRRFYCCVDQASTLREKKLLKS